MKNGYLYHIFLRAMAFFAIAIPLITSCTDIYDDEFYHSSPYPEYKPPQGATYNTTHNARRVFVLISLGYNDLSYDLYDDIQEMITGKVPGYGFEEDVVLVFRHGTEKFFDFHTPSSPMLTRVYSKGGEIAKDTLKIYPNTTISANKDIIEDILTIAKENFPAKSYGMLMSSHGTGWAPQGYCYSPPDKSSSGHMNLSSDSHEGPTTYLNGRPLTKSIGSHFIGSQSNAIEIDIPDLADAIPMHLDYIIFDSCLMGGVEVAYELKEKCDKICFSQTEVLAEGMNYKNLLSYLFDYEESNLTAFAEDYYTFYRNQTMSYMRSATISVVDCRKLEPLAEVVAKHSKEIKTLGESASRNNVQGYFQPRHSRYHGIFFDLKDIIKKAGASNEEIEELDSALENCIVCKYATEKFLDEFKINTHSGLSMYLYDSDRYILNEYYKSLKWEQKVRLTE